MSVPTKKLVYDFRRKYNAINSGRNKDIALVDIIAYLNEAYQVWYENRVFVAQTNQKVRNDLRVFKEDHVKLNIKSYTDGSVIAEYPDGIYKRLNQIAVVGKTCCPNKDKEVIPRIIESDDLHEARHNPFRKADYYFEQLNAIETADGLVLYHDDAMEIKEVHIDYYRKLQELHAPSLEECDGEKYYDYCGRIIIKDQDFEGSDTYSANDVVNVAVLMASRDTGDVSGFQTQLNLILGTQQMYK